MIMRKRRNREKSFEKKRKSDEVNLKLQERRFSKEKPDHESQEHLRERRKRTKKRISEKRGRE